MSKNNLKCTTEKEQITQLIRAHRDYPRINWICPCERPKYNSDGVAVNPCKAATKGKQNKLLGLRFIMQMDLPEPTNAYNYYICLHEVGHLYCGNDELKATRWARQHALYWNDEMSTAALDGLMTHVYNDVMPWQIVQFKKELGANYDFKSEIRRMQDM